LFEHYFIVSCRVVWNDDLRMGELFRLTIVLLFALIQLGNPLSIAFWNPGATSLARELFGSSGGAQKANWLNILYSSIKCLTQSHSHSAKIKLAPFLFKYALALYQTLSYILILPRSEFKRLLESVLRPLLDLDTRLCFGNNTKTRLMTMPRSLN
jgi:hypothetical protein